MSYPVPPPPPAPDYFRASDHENALLVFRVKQFENHYSGWSETQPAVRCDVEAIFPPAGPWHDAWIGNELIVGQLKNAVGKVFFTRLSRRGRAFVLDAISYGDEKLIDDWRSRKQALTDNVQPQHTAADTSQQRNAHAVPEGVSAPPGTPASRTWVVGSPNDPHTPTTPPPVDNPWVGSESRPAASQVPADDDIPF